MMQRGREEATGQEARGAEFRLQGLWGCKARRQGWQPLEEQGGNGEAGGNERRGQLVEGDSWGGSWTRGSCWQWRKWRGS